MIIVVLVFGFLFFWIFLRILDFYGWSKRQRGKKRQRELEAKNTKPLKGYELCSPQFQAYMRGEIEAGRAKPKTKKQEPIEEYDPTYFGERGCRYEIRYSKKTGRPYRHYW